MSYPATIEEDAQRHYIEQLESDYRAELKKRETLNKRLVRLQIKLEDARTALARIVTTGSAS